MLNYKNDINYSLVESGNMLQMERLLRLTIRESIFVTHDNF
ncbi:hypothetical protein [Clostridium estertheticum]|nr:hypothetical protein [Clostridium estertheticum]